ncbi:hypothetical protein TL16_g06760 [Triparma laevis f. inornata]|uniref:Uncharacterized protein n=1 Tax=Triparma laevis f. inornata TaxID=1714386 RepID=A0A9W7AW11_9STRA|nr:hypothetical protein TL16_g06760 [Triparma laevis f. inornata]
MIYIPSASLLTLLRPLFPTLPTSIKISNKYFTAEPKVVTSIQGLGLENVEFAILECEAKTSSSDLQSNLQSLKFPEDAEGKLLLVKCSSESEYDNFVGGEEGGIMEEISVWCLDQFVELCVWRDYEHEKPEGEKNDASYNVLVSLKL